MVMGKSLEALRQMVKQVVADPAEQLAKLGVADDLASVISGSKGFQAAQSLLAVDPVDDTEEVPLSQDQ